MKEQTIIDKYILDPIHSIIWKIKYKIFTQLMKEHSMDWGKYGMEEIYKMYSKYQSEINRN